MSAKRRAKPGWPAAEMSSMIIDRRLCDGEAVFPSAGGRLCGTGEKRGGVAIGAGALAFSRPNNGGRNMRRNRVWRAPLMWALSNIEVSAVSHRACDFAAAAGRGFYWRQRPGRGGTASSTYRSSANRSSALFSWYCRQARMGVAKCFFVARHQCAVNDVYQKPVMAAS